MTFRHADREDHPIDPETERIARIVLDCAFQVHTDLGPGLLESIYQECLCWALEERGLTVETEVAVPITYLGRTASRVLRVDLVVEGRVLVEVKAVEDTTSTHEAQLLTYLKLTGHQLGFLLNFNVPRLKQGIQRLVHTGDRFVGLDRNEPSETGHPSQGDQANGRHGSFSRG